MSQAAARGELANPFREYDAVFSAATTLADALEQSVDGKDSGTRQLLRAVDDLDAAASTRFGFAAPATPGSALPATVDQALLKAAADAQLASVLLAASEAVGEPGASAGGQPLRTAVEEAQKNLASLATDTTATRPVVAAAAALAGSPGDVSAAFTAFKGHAEATLARILEDSDGVVTAAWTALGSQKDRVVEAFRQVAGLFGDLAPVGGLLRRAWDKLLSAIRAIYDVTSRVPIDDVANQLQRLRDAVSSRAALAYAFASEAVRDEVAKLVARASLTPEDVDRASADVIALGERFSTLARRARLVTTAIGLGGFLLTMHATGPMAVLAIPAAHAAVVAAVIVIGMDYTDSETLLNMVRGVRDIAQGLAG